MVRIKIWIILKKIFGNEALQTLDLDASTDSDFIRRNALFEPDNFPVLGKRGKLYLFDTLTDLWEV